MHESNILQLDTDKKALTGEKKRLVEQLYDIRSKQTQLNNE